MTNTVENDDWKWDQDRWGYVKMMTEMKGGGGTEGNNEWGVQRETKTEMRKNEMVVRWFQRNSNWKDIKNKTEHTMNRTGKAYERVSVIGQIASFAIVKFADFDGKRVFKEWLSQHGAEVKDATGLWFSDNADKDTRDKERAVGKMKKALMLAKPNRTDVTRDYRKGTVYVENTLVAKWDDIFKVMQSKGEAKEVRDKYEELMKEGRDEGEFSE